MVCALLSFGFFTYHSPHHGSKIGKKFTSGRSSGVVGAAIQKSPSCFALVGQYKQVHC